MRGDKDRNWKLVLSEHIFYKSFYFGTIEMFYVIKTDTKY